MGVAGMLVFIPLCSVLYSLLREWTNKRLLSRNISTDSYDQPDHETPVDSKDETITKQVNVKKAAGKCLQLFFGVGFSPFIDKE